MKKDLDRLVRTLVREHDCTVQPTGKGHRKVSGPNGGFVIAAVTPGNYRGLLNFMRDVRHRLGINLKERS